MAHIDKSRWKVLSPLLDQLLDIERGERAARLDQIRCDDHALARELESLLAAMAIADRESFLEGSVLACMEDEPIDRHTPRKIDGRGGTGRP